MPQKNENDMGDHNDIPIDKEEGSIEDCMQEESIQLRRWMR
jgi:hypothetical protein